MSKYTLELPQNIHHNLKVIAAKEQKTMKSIVSAVLNIAVESDGKILTKQDVLREYWRNTKRKYYNAHKEQINMRKRIKRKTPTNVSMIDFMEKIAA